MEYVMLSKDEYAWQTDTQISNKAFGTVVYNAPQVNDS